ncbi:hypothetical protein HUU05_07840 [candidate division KSB1 bacterium]|nr:hypothetical protein [candidate division KSB1 bacterium]
MIIVLQFPISDARPFCPDHGQRLDKPYWPSPVTAIHPQFVHFFGRAVARRRGADAAWSDESAFCLAKRALRFDNLGKQRVGAAHHPMVPRVAFRRLFCDGRAVARVEIGISENPRAGRLKGLDSASVLAIISEVCALSTWVPQPEAEQREWKPLLRQGKNLTRLFAAATTSLSLGALHTSAQALVLNGNPLLVVELDAREEIGTPPGFIRVGIKKTLGAQLSFGRLKTNAGIVGLWILQRNKATRDQVRSLRLCLLRLHAEQEVLDLVLHQLKSRHILKQRDFDIEEELNDYLNKATRLIKRDDWSGISQSAILAAFDAAEQVTAVASRINLVERFEGARRQIWQKIEDYQIRRAAVRVVPVTYVESGGTFVEKNVITNVSGQGNIVNVAEYMANITNTVQMHLEQSSAPSEVQALVKKLAQQIEEIAAKIDPQKTQQLGGDLAVLSKEMAMPQPRKRWYQTALESIKEVATTIGEIGKPILETIKLLSPLLIGS